MSRAIYLLAQRNRQTARPTPQTETPPQHPRRANPQGRKEDPLPAVRINSLGVHQGPPRPDQRSAYRENISLQLPGGGTLGDSWSGLPWLSYTSRGRKPKIRFLISSPRRASWCLETRLTHHHGITPSPVLTDLLTSLCYDNSTLTHSLTHCCA